MFKRSVVYVLCLAVLNLGSPMLANAAMIGTLQAVESSTRAQDLATVNAALAQDQVRQQFAALGVDPAQIDSRVAPHGLRTPFAGGPDVRHARGR
jgi:hypothetical protein